MLTSLWKDETGYVISTELILIASISVIGLVIGLVSVRDAVVQEYGDAASAVGVLNQSYRFDGDNHTGGSSIPASGEFVAGSQYIDNTDACETTDQAGQPPAGMQINIAPNGEG